MKRDLKRALQLAKISDDLAERIKKKVQPDEVEGFMANLTMKLIKAAYPPEHYIECIRNVYAVMVLHIRVQDIVEEHYPDKTDKDMEAVQEIVNRLWKNLENQNKRSGKETVV